MDFVGDPMTADTKAKLVRLGISQASIDNYIKSNNPESLTPEMLTYLLGERSASNYFNTKNVAARFKPSERGKYIAEAGTHVAQEAYGSFSLRDLDRMSQKEPARFDKFAQLWGDMIERHFRKPCRISPPITVTWRGTR